MTKIIEQYEIKSYCEKPVVVRLYADGDMRCSCEKFKKSVFSCSHINAVKNHTAQIVSARRFK